MSELYERIYAVVDTIPVGKVASYKQVAQAAGLYRGARLVGWALRSLPAGTTIPWQRVINEKGQISIVNPQVPQSVQKDLLEQEGHRIEHKEGFFKLVEPRWHSFIT